VRHGWRERAHALLEFFLAARQPVVWNQWPEVVGRDTRRPRFVGDMPHGWVASDYVSAVLDLFAYERDLDNALVVAAGVPASWLRDTGIEVKGLRTHTARSAIRCSGRRDRADRGEGLRLPGRHRPRVAHAWRNTGPNLSTQARAVDPTTSSATRQNRHRRALSRGPT
jgi:hypothetical protein